MSDSEREAILLYRLYSEQEWCAGWMGNATHPDRIKDFKAWLRGHDAEEHPAQAWSDYEIAAAPALAAAVKEVRS